MDEGKVLSALRTIAERLETCADEIYWLRAAINRENKDLRAPADGGLFDKQGG